MQEELMLAASKDKHTIETLAVGFNTDEWEDEETYWIQTHWDHLNDALE